MKPRQAGFAAVEELIRDLAEHPDYTDRQRFAVAQARLRHCAEVAAVANDRVAEIKRELASVRDDLESALLSNDRMRVEVASVKTAERLLRLQIKQIGDKNLPAIERVKDRCAELGIEICIESTFVEISCPPGKRMMFGGFYNQTYWPSDTAGMMRDLQFGLADAEESEMCEAER